ncbi:MAG: hypothetical protein IT480_11980, partial [Gammaproteobacteria bacterium]|nr:hypothetical protein [Gammaproteobacteria bacterium]
MKHAPRAVAIAAWLALGSASALAQDASGIAPGVPPGGGSPAMPGAPPGMPPGMPMMLGGGPPMMPGGPPGAAALYIEDGVEATAKEYVPGQYRAYVRSGAQGLLIEGARISSGDYSFTGVAVTGEKSVVTLNRVIMQLGVTQDADPNSPAGAALNVSNGATVYLNRSDLAVDGAQRYVTETSGPSKLIVNDSR